MTHRDIASAVMCPTAAAVHISAPATIYNIFQAWRTYRDGAWWQIYSPRYHQTVALLPISLVAACHDCEADTRKIHDFFLQWEEGTLGLDSVLLTSTLNEVPHGMARYRASGSL